MHRKGPPRQKVVQLRLDATEARALVLVEGDDAQCLCPRHVFSFLWGWCGQKRLLGWTVVLRDRRGVGDVGEHAPQMQGFVSYDMS